MAGYYDIVLGLIPVSLFGTTFTLTLLGMSVLIGVVIGSLIAIGLIAHAMFVNTPGSQSTTTQAQPSPATGHPNAD